MNKISENHLIEETIEKGFQASEMRFLSKEPTMYMDLKKEILENKEITEVLKTGISEIVRDSIDVQVKKSFEHGGSNFLKELQALRFSNLDEQAEKLSEKRKSMRTVGVQLVQMDDNGNVEMLDETKEHFGSMHKVDSAEFNQMMKDIFAKEDSEREQKVASYRNNYLEAEPDKDFLFESQEMESKFLSRSSKKLQSVSPSNQPSKSRKSNDLDNMNYSDYYDNVFNSFLAYSNSQVRGSNVNLANMSSTKSQREGQPRRIDVSAGLSQFLRSKIDSFVEEYTKEAVYKRGTIESMIKGMSVVKSEIKGDGGKEGETKLLKLDEDPREKLILSDLETIKEHECDKTKEKTKPNL